MSAKESRPPHRNDLLEDAIAAVQNTSVEDSLVERCRRNALDIANEEPNKRLRPKDDRLSWFLPLAVAASMLLMVNLAQAYARLPSSDRELTAIHTDSDSQRRYVYSDLRIEPAPSLDSNQQD
jgi:hypothetical protein